MDAPDFRQGPRIDARTVVWFGLIVHAIVLAVWVHPRLFPARPLLLVIDPERWFDRALSLLAMGGFCAIVAITWRAFRSRAKSWLFSLPPLAAALASLIPLTFSGSIVGLMTFGASPPPELAGGLAALQAGLSAATLVMAAPGLELAGLFASAAAIAWAAIADDGIQARFDRASLVAAGLAGAGIVVVTLVTGFTLALLPATTALVALSFASRKLDHNDDDVARDAFAAFAMAIAGLLSLGTAAWCRTFGRSLGGSEERLTVAFERAGAAIQPALYPAAVLAVAALVVFAGHWPAIRQSWRSSRLAFAALLITVVIPTAIVAVRSHGAVGEMRTAIAKLSEQERSTASSAEVQPEPEPVIIEPHQIDEVLAEMNDAKAPVERHAAEEEVVPAEEEELAAEE